MQNKRTLFVTFFFIFTLTVCLMDCGKKWKIYRLAAGPPGTSYQNVGKIIADVVSSQRNLNIKAIFDPVNIDGKTLPLDALTNCYLLFKGGVEFAISQNDVAILPLLEEDNSELSNLRSVIPLYPEILFIIYKPHLEPEAKSLRELVQGKKVAMGPENSGTARLTKILLQEFNIQPGEYQPQYTKFEETVLSDTVDICCLVTGFDNNRVQKSLQQGGKIFSLGDPNLAGNGSAADGFCLKYPLAKTFIIPNKIYQNLPEQPALTVAIDAVLLTREDVADDVVYNVIEIILNRKQFMVMDLDNKLFSHITEQFDPLKLRFPLHKGAKHYLERNKPTFWERYAELFGVVFSIFIAFVGGIATVTKWRSLRKKNRIDTYYKGVMDIQIQIDDFKTEPDCQNAIQQLKYLRQNAFEQLISEKLLADESFRIFITFINDTRKEINSRMQEIR